jgi:hypothetical protein
MFSLASFFIVALTKYKLCSRWFSLSRRPRHHRVHCVGSDEETITGCHWGLAKTDWDNKDSLGNPCLTQCHTKISQLLLYLSCLKLRNSMQVTIV